MAVVRRGWRCGNRPRPRVARADRGKSVSSPDHRRVNIDDFGSLLNDSLHSEQPGAAITALAQRFSYVFPDDRVLSVLAGLGPLVEMGAGTGYWAYRLRTLGVDIVALDLAPPDGARSNRYHPSSPTWTKVIAGDHTGPWRLPRPSAAALLASALLKTRRVSDVLRWEYRCADWGWRPSDLAPDGSERDVQQRRGVSSTRTRSLPGCRAHVERLEASTGSMMPTR